MKYVRVAVAVAILTVLVLSALKRDGRRDNAFAGCSTLGGTLIISADERYICVPDAVEVGK